MHMCIRIHSYVYISRTHEDKQDVNLHVYPHTFICIHMSIYIHLYINTCICVSTYIHMYTYRGLMRTNKMRIYTCIHKDSYVYICVSTYVYIYIYIYV